MALRKPTAGEAANLQPNAPKRIEAAGPEPRTLTLPASAGGAGGLSAEDLAAIRGEIATPAPVNRVAESYEKSVAQTAETRPDRAFDDQGTPTPLGELVQRLATLEHNFSLLETAMEAGFERLASRAAPAPRIVQQDHVPLPASRAEEAAYNAENFRRYEARDPSQPQFNGIDAWRAEGRPGL